MHRFSTTCLAVALFACLMSNVHAGTIDLYEGNNGTQNKIGTITDEAGQSINLKKHDDIDNDEARSLTLNDVREGAVIKLYDDPKGNANDDDWVEIHVKKSSQQYTVNTFEKTYEDDFVKVTYHPNNGLDGKVSHIKVD